MTPCHIIEGYYFNNGRAVLENCFKYLLFLNIISEITHFECCGFFHHTFTSIYLRLVRINWTKIINLIPLFP